MRKVQKSRRKLLTDSTHQLLNVKELMDTILKEAESLPQVVKQEVVSARDASWKAFVAEQEKMMSH